MRPSAESTDQNAFYRAGLEKCMYVQTTQAAVFCLQVPTHLYCVRARFVQSVRQEINDVMVICKTNGSVKPDS